ncbi:MAG: alkaline phosphatase family protein [Bacteroidota bacterium]|nr:alkaline phosphatase family protein [Bacteroidota bacterium]MDP4248990.1 alkaline phosphatase family protein [Bacteroidota bacterium]
MNYPADRGFKKAVSFLLVFSLFACNTTRVYKSSVVTDSNRYTITDTITSLDDRMVRMPYNRLIDPAGAVIRFGNPNQENHSLDCVLLPGTQVLAVEDRYGVTFINTGTNKFLYHIDYNTSPVLKGLVSTYSGIKAFRDGQILHVFWGVSKTSTGRSYVLDAVWDGATGKITDSIPFRAVAPSPIAIPNDLAIHAEDGENYLYVVLSGNSQLTKIRLKDKVPVWTVSTGMAPFGIALTDEKAYVTNWAGPVPVQGTGETAGIPFGQVYVDSRTGATAMGTVDVVDLKTGEKQSEIRVGLHPNAIIISPDKRFVYVANGNSDQVSVINTGTDELVDSLSVRLNGISNPFMGDAPNALAIDRSGKRLYVANGMDNAVAVIKLGAKASVSGKGRNELLGFIPTEAYPAGLALENDEVLCVANLEGEGARIAGKNGAYNSHHAAATVSVIPLPDGKQLKDYTRRVENANLRFRGKLAQQLPRSGIMPKPVPERIGEPSVFKHVVYIIKENRTYDQVLGDMTIGNGMSSLCVFGEEVTPNEHQLARDYLLLDNYLASGKSSAEGHQWTDAAMTSDYVEKNVRAWFQSYPHVQTDALVYNKEGFIWNNALDHGKSVRIYGEACSPEWHEKLDWKDIYKLYQEGRTFDFKNVSTISRVRPILSQQYPGFDDPKVNDQYRAGAFIKELKAFEQMPGDQMPQLMILALPEDHTTGMREGYPTPRAMVADNDLALGRIVNAISESRFFDSTVIFVTEDDSQDGWDHVSAYRTTGFVISPYSVLHQTVHTNYNQTCIVRTIEQILGIPPMNALDATALPMFDCFSGTFDKTPYHVLPNRIPLDEMNKSPSALKGKAKHFAVLSALPQFDHIDGGDDDLLNRIVWFSVNGKKAFPGKLTGSDKDNDDK